MRLPSILYTITEALYDHGVRALLVGGAVRDMVMGREVKDYDIEVYGLQALEELESILARFGSVNQVGRSFGIVKLRVGEEEYDFSFPRKEQKTGKGHRGFSVSVNGSIGFKEAAKRRDFTINALGYDILTGEILDPFGGLNDIQYGVLRYIDGATFVEDPLRVYRAVQFAARFRFEVAQETAKLCKEMVEEGMLEELPKERVYEEWKKFLLKAPKPSTGFELMREWGIVERYFSELHALIGCPQDPKWHIEGDVWTHTLMALDAMQGELGMRNEELGIDEKKKLKLLFAVLCHDFGKPLTTTIEYKSGEVVQWQDICNNRSILEEMQTITPQSLPQGYLSLRSGALLTPHSIKRIRAIGHEKASIEPARTFMYHLTNEHDFIESILPLVEHHLKPSQFYAQGAKAGAIRRLATKVNIEELVLVSAADHFGRGEDIEFTKSISRKTHTETPYSLPQDHLSLRSDVLSTPHYFAGEWLLEKAHALNVQKEPLKPIIQGRDLIGLGMTPSVRFKEILNEIYQLQMDGAIEDKEAALNYVKKRHKS